MSIKPSHLWVLDAPPCPCCVLGPRNWATVLNRLSTRRSTLEVCPHQILDSSRLHLILRLVCCTKAAKYCNMIYSCGKPSGKWSLHLYLNRSWSPPGRQIFAGRGTECAGFVDCVQSIAWMLPNSTDSFYLVSSTLFSARGCLQPCNHAVRHSALQTLRSIPGHRSRLLTVAPL